MLKVLDKDHMICSQRLVESGESKFYLAHKNNSGWGLFFPYYGQLGPCFFVTGHTQILLMSAICGASNWCNFWKFVDHFLKYHHESRRDKTSWDSTDTCMSSRDFLLSWGLTPSNYFKGWHAQWIHSPKSGVFRHSKKLTSFSMCDSPTQGTPPESDEEKISLAQ